MKQISQFQFWQLAVHRDVEAQPTAVAATPAMDKIKRARAKKDGKVNSNTRSPAPTPPEGPNGYARLAEEAAEPSQEDAIKDIPSDKQVIPCPPLQ